jgi:hypothetical protein
VDQDLKQFSREWLCVVAATFFVVVFIAFFSMPLALGFHPGEPSGRVDSSTLHAT